MWFRFPEGCTALSVDLQEFKPEAEDKEGFKYFRAPEHLAALILNQPGFRVMTPEETDIPDLPKVDKARDQAIERLGAQVEALKMEKEAAMGNLAPLQEENVALRAQIAQLEKAIANSAPKDAEAKSDNGAVMDADDKKGKK